jgi:hypothetical protein
VATAGGNVGSFVRLESGLLGVVADQNPGSLLQPTVRTILSTQSREFVEPQLLDLSSESCADQITGIEHPSHWGVRDPSIYLQQP